MFGVGQQVVCVDDGQRSTRFAPTVGIKKGSVYTIRSLGFWPGDGCTPVVFLKETQNDNNLQELDCGYAPSRFRPVAKRSDTLTIESFLTIKPGFEEPRRVVEPVRRKEGAK